MIRCLSTAPPAIENFSKAIDLDPNYAEAYLGKGDAMMYLLFTKGAAATPDWLDWLEEMGRCYEKAIVLGADMEKLDLFDRIYTGSTATRQWRLLGPYIALYCGAALHGNEFRKFMTEAMKGLDQFRGLGDVIVDTTLAAILQICTNIKRLILMVTLSANRMQG